jgi:hypothetical protein
VRTSSDDTVHGVMMPGVMGDGRANIDAAQARPVEAQSPRDALRRRAMRGENRLRHGRQSDAALLHPSRLPIPSAFDGPVPAPMNELLSPLRRILDGHKKEEREEVEGEEGDQEEDGEEGGKEGAEEEAHTECGLHEADAA